MGHAIDAGAWPPLAGSRAEQHGRADVSRGVLWDFSGGEMRLACDHVSCCPTGCPYLGRNGCRVACGNEEIECPVMTGVMKAEEAKDAKTDG